MRGTPPHRRQTTRAFGLSPSSCLTELTPTELSILELDFGFSPEPALPTRQIHIEEAAYSDDELTIDNEDYDSTGSLVSGRSYDTLSPPPPSFGKHMPNPPSDDSTPVPPLQPRKTPPIDPPSPEGNSTGIKVLQRLSSRPQQLQHPPSKSSTLRRTRSHHQGAERSSTTVYY